MMKGLKRIGALVLAVMMFAVAGTAFAEETLTDGKAGEFTDYDASSASTTGDSSKQTLERTVIIKKELISVNANGTAVKAPAFTYVYTVTPASVGNLTVTDAAAKHATNTAVEAPVNAGITTELVVTGTSEGTAGDAASAAGTLVFTNSSVLTSSSDGTGTGVNTYDIKLNFSNVIFPKSGVYRYQIAETLADNKTYDGIAVKDGGTNTLWLDVYVDGSKNIYGYVCMAANASVAPSTVKTNGFVAASGGADTYYTYDLTLSKDVVNDVYAEGNIAFPFTVIFRNAESYATTFAISETAGNGSTGFSPAAGTPVWSGVALVKDGGAITYTGIPAGVDVDVYETNVATGVTYNVSTAVNGGDAVTDNNVSSGSAPASAVAQGTTKAAYESTKATVNTTKATAVSKTQTVAITNTLVLISPTGYVVRYAPYALILIAGVLLFVIARKHKKNADEEE